MTTAPISEAQVQQLEARVSALCKSIMHAVANGISAAKREPRDLDQVVAVMREEVKAFISGDKYAAEREAVMKRSIHDGYIVATIAASCIGRIEWKQSAETVAGDYSVTLGEWTLMHSHWTALFNRVAPKPNWKTAIRARANASETEMRQILEAITFFTGSIGTAAYNGDGTFTFTAAGYYATCGA